MQKFSSQVEADLLEEVRQVAAAEGLQFQTVVGEALAAWVEKTKGDGPRPEVISHAKTSMVRHRRLYAELAKQ